MASLLDVDAFLDDARFSRSFVWPADPNNGRAKPFKVTYADIGYRNEAQPWEENTVLFFGPMMASRWLHVAKDDIAKRYKVRIINPDRPDMGGTDHVDAADKLRTWRG